MEKTVETRNEVAHENEIRKAMAHIKFHGSIVLRGFARTVYGALTAGLLGCAVYGFICTKGEAGYVAVIDFVASCATLVVALCNLYVMGMKKRGARK